MVMRRLRRRRRRRGSLERAHDKLRGVPGGAAEVVVELEQVGALRRLRRDERADLVDGHGQLPRAVGAHKGLQGAVQDRDERVAAALGASAAYGGGGGAGRGEHEPRLRGRGGVGEEAAHPAQEVAVARPAAAPGAEQPRVERARRRGLARLARLGALRRLDQCQRRRGGLEERRHYRAAAGSRAGSGGPRGAAGERGRGGDVVAVVLAHRLLLFGICLGSYYAYPQAQKRSARCSSISSGGAAGSSQRRARNAAAGSGRRQRRCAAAAASSGAAGAACGGAGISKKQ